MTLLRTLLLCAACCAAPAAAGEDLLLGSVVKSDKWKMDRVSDTETFTGNVSFRNPLYSLKADSAVFSRPRAAWDLNGAVYVQRLLPAGALIEARCQSAYFLQGEERAALRRGALPVRMKYRGADGRVLTGVADAALAENRERRMTFDGNFVLTTENLELASQLGVYDDALQTFLLKSSAAAPGAPAELPAAVGKREGYDFAIVSENIKFFRDSRDIKFYNKVSGWVKDAPRPAPERQ